MKKIYLDNAATTKLDDEVLKQMLPYFTETYGNPSSLHAFGREAAKAVDAARDAVASVLNCKPSEIYFTSGGSESDNWALKGLVESYGKKIGKHIITTAIEHHAILETCEALEKLGCEITKIPVDRNGIVDLEKLKEAVRDDTLLVSVMYANNEVGSIQPIAEIGEFCREKGIFFHTDAVQATGALKIDVKKENIDLLSASAHKFHGPKGIGFLYVRSGIKLARLIAGGMQERNMRAGTTDTPLIVGLAAALKKSAENREKDNERIAALRDRLIDRVLAEIPYSHLNGGRERRLPNNANLSFDFIEGESILFSLDMAGIAVSSGSACSAGSLEASHVVIAMGEPIEQAHSSIRFSLGNDTTLEEIDYTVDRLKEIIAKLRQWSPLWNEKKGSGEYV